ncbi:hypothetical protein ACLKA7_017449 [Drosophila subpalustris]
MQRRHFGTPQSYPWSSSSSSIAIVLSSLDAWLCLRRGGGVLPPPFSHMLKMPADKRLNLLQLQHNACNFHNAVATPTVNCNWSQLAAASIWSNPRI